MRVEFTIFITPQSVQYGARAFVRNGKVSFFSDKKKETYIKNVCILAREYVPDSAPWQEPIKLDITFFLPRPKCMMGKKHPDGAIPHSSRPDRDNILKGTQDGLSKAGFWADDSQICTGTTAKFYCEKGGEPRISVTIATFDGEEIFSRHSTEEKHVRQTIDDLPDEIKQQPKI